MPRPRRSQTPRETPIQTQDPPASPLSSSTEELINAPIDDEEGTSTEKPEEFSTAGLKEIGNLASWTVSTAKPGCGVEALRDEDVNLFWQSDGPQPHLLNIHFFKRVSIVAIRLYLDWENDESYTPTKMSLLAGTGYHDLVEFRELSFEQPRGWININLSGVGGGGGAEGGGKGKRKGKGAGSSGGGEAGAVLRAWLVQVKVSENHQNGKDTHVRGLQIFAREEGDEGEEGGAREEWGAVGLGGGEDELR
ncbi:MAG: anaphase promoting complex subunit doc1 [Geoglossum simile]|nr:MAG: anaphase promoting complex subunit doc1 [Geoglossum simile]